MEDRPQNSSGQFAYRRQKLEEAKKRKKVLQFTGIGAAMLVVGGVLLFVLLRDAGAARPDAGTADPGASTDAAADDTAQSEPTPPPEDGPTPPPIDEEALAAAAGVSRTTAEDRIAAVGAETEALCTGTPADVRDPDTWNAAGKELMDQLEADPVYQSQGFSASAATIAAARTEAINAISRWQETEGMTLPDSYPYLIAVNRAADTVTVYAADGEGRYTVPYMAMVCSTGPDTPAGFFRTPIKYGWQMLFGHSEGENLYGQYATRITGSILFHSVPYVTQHQDDLEYDEYNDLGQPVSQGCVRLAVRDVRWIYAHCPIGTPVVIYDNAESPGPMGKPGTIHIDTADVTLRGWDPTDPNPDNPWPAEYRRGTTIMSETAKADQAAEEAAGTWAADLNDTNLLGNSTDPNAEGAGG